MRKIRSDLWTTPSQHRSPLRLLAASRRIIFHQLFMMTMASRHRRRRHADPPQDENIAPSSSHNGIAPLSPL
jgi:hypothetical protein